MEVEYNGLLDAQRATRICALSASGTRQYCAKVRV
jgi:hypothetical protein